MIIEAPDGAPALAGREVSDIRKAIKWPENNLYHMYADEEILLFDQIYLFSVCLIFFSLILHRGLWILPFVDLLALSDHEKRAVGDFWDTRKGLMPWITMDIEVDTK